MVKTIFFDLDGVLIDSEPWHKKAREATLNKYGLDVSWIEEIHKPGSNSTEVFTEFVETRNLNIPVRDLVESKRTMYWQLVQGRNILFPGIQKTLQGLAVEYKIGLATASPAQSVNLVLKESGVLDLFHYVVTADDVKVQKPDPAIYIKILEKSGFAKQEAFAVEDSSVGIEAAKRAGIGCIAVKTGIEERFSIKPDFIIGNFDEDFNKFKEYLKSV